MKKPFIIWDIANKQVVEAFEYVAQAEAYISRRLGGSKNFTIIDKRKRRDQNVQQNKF